MPFVLSYSSINFEICVHLGYNLHYSHSNTGSHPLSNYRKLGDGLFLQSCAEVAQLYPKIKYENIIIDNCCMQVYTAFYSPDIIMNDLVLT